MSLWSFLAVAAFAAETVISPIPDDVVMAIPDVVKPDISFGQIVDIPVLTPQILGETTQITPTPTPTIIQTRKKSYKIAFLGDSMTDTMGPGLPAIASRLATTYPTTNFTLSNYGVGATTIDDAIRRISSFAETNPDVVVLESCAYNPYPNEPGIDRHWLALAKAVDTLRSLIPGVKIVIAATVAPNSRVFGDGAPNIAFDPEDKIRRTTTIKEYLESTVKFAAGERLPLADAYHASLDTSGDGKLIYINSGDHIHYSDTGRALFAEKVVRALRTVL